jgi:arsenate reductase-like glutaredoxin family protein
MLKNNTPQTLALSGKNNSGKNLLASIIQIIMCDDKEIVEEFFDNPGDTLNTYAGVFEMQSKFQNKRFVDKANSIVAEVLGVSIRTLDNKTYMTTELGQDWWYYLIGGEYIPYNETNHYTNEERSKLSKYLVKPNPQTLKELIIQEGGSKLIDPTLWVNKTLDSIKTNQLKDASSYIISDVLFKGEKKAIEAMNGVTIRMVRYKLLSEWLEEHSIDLSYMDEYKDVELSDKDFLEFINELDSETLRDVSDRLNHTSQTDLDDEEFDYVIHNNGTIEDLVNEVMDILTAEGIVTSEELVSKEY